MQYVAGLVAEPMAIALLLVIALLVALGAYSLYLRRPIESQRQAADEANLKKRVAEKVARLTGQGGLGSDQNLTDSGIISVLEMMDALVSGGNVDEAEKWALNAIHNHPNRVEVPLKLAEIYYGAGRQRAFMAVVKNLSRKKLAVPPAAWEELARMGVELAPDDPFFQAMRERPSEHPSNALN